MDGPALTREYYRAIDEDDYDALAAILAEGFVHHRPDRTLSGRERFVRFMREERPATDTEHVVETVYATVDDEQTADHRREGDRFAAEVDRFAAEGVLRRADGTEWFGFVDTFAVTDGQLQSLTTYTNGA